MSLHRCTRAEFQRLLDVGCFTDCRVELIEGQIVESPPITNAHAVSLKLTEDALVAAFGPGFWTRSQLPLAISEFSEPLPDLAVVPGKPRDHAEHPRTALLVVEISDSTLAYDRKQKSGLYASGRLAEYWIVNLVDRQLEVHQGPIPDSSWHCGWRYFQRTVLSSAQQASIRSATIAVAELLP